jgi:hypothetical protein
MQPAVSQRTSICSSTPTEKPIAKAAKLQQKHKIQMGSTSLDKCQ